MSYNVKITRYHDEIQIAYYKDFSVPSANDCEVMNYETDKQNVKSDKQSAKSDKQSAKTDNETDNKVRSTRRSKQSVYDIARANNWEWFATFTFENNRYDYDYCKKSIQTFLNNMKKRNCPHMEYLAVPEQHKDGAYHFHALLMNIDENLLCDSYEKDKLMFKKYAYGISQLERVKDTDRVSMYITKYITKDLVNDVKGRQRYLCSNGCKRGEVKKLNIGDMSIMEFWENNIPNYDLMHEKRYNGFYDVSYMQFKKKSEN